MNKTDQGAGQPDKRFIGMGELPSTNQDPSPAIELGEEGFDRLATWLLGRLTSSKYFNKYTLLILLIALTLVTLFATRLHPTNVQIQGHDWLYFDLLQLLMLEMAALLYFFLTKHIQLPRGIVILILL